VLRRSCARSATTATPAETWRALGSLVEEPGAHWLSDDGDAGGHVLLTVAGRRLAASWRPSGDQHPAGLLDIRIGHERDGGSRVEVALAVVESAGTDADAWARRLAERIASRATERAQDA
jgi:uncharacterized protein YndB with AHSA1/START domain